MRGGPARRSSCPPRTGRRTPPQAAAPQAEPPAARARREAAAAGAGRAARRASPTPRASAGRRDAAPPRETGYPHPSLARRRAAERAARVPTPQERLRNAFSSDLPENILRRRGREPEPEPAPARAVAYARGADRTTSARGRRPVAGSPVIRVVGVGGAGVNAVNRMIEAEVAGRRVHRRQHRHAVAAAVDGRRHAAHRRRGHARPRRRLQPGARPRRRRWRTTTASSPCSRAADMVFITAGAGGGTGTGAAPDRGAHRPRDRRAHRRHRHEAVRLRGHAPRGRPPTTGIDALADEVDTLIVVPNNRLLTRARQAHVDGRGVPRRRRRAAPGRAGHLATWSRCPGLINLDFADVRTIMSEAGAGAARHRHGHRATSARSRPPSRPCPRRCWRRAWRARGRSCCRSPAAATCRCGRSTRRRRPSRRPPTRTRTSSSARWSTRSSRTRSG